MSVKLTYCSKNKEKNAPLGKQCCMEAVHQYLELFGGNLEEGRLASVFEAFLGKC